MSLLLPLLLNLGGGASTPTQAGFQSQFSSQLRKYSAAPLVRGIAWAPQVIAGPVLDTRAGWQSQFQPQTLRASAVPMVSGQAWEPQAGFSLTGTPADFNFYTAFPPQRLKRSTALLVNGIAWDAQVVPTETPQQAGWQSSFSEQRLRPSAVPMVSGTAWAPYVITGTQTPAEAGWQSQFQPQGLRINPVPMASGLAWRAGQPITGTPEQAGWQSQFNSQTLRINSTPLANGLAWPPREAQTGTPSQAGFQSIFAPTALRINTVPLHSGLAWRPVSLSTAAVTPTQFGWHVPFSRAKAIKSLVPFRDARAMLHRALAVFPTEYPGLRVYNGNILELSIVGWLDTLAGDRVSIEINGTVYAAYLVPVTDPNASPVRVQTETGTKAIRYKSTTTPNFGWFRQFTMAKPKASKTPLAPGIRRP